MKKFLIIFSATTLFSCSNSDDNGSVNPNENSINPPTWVQGTWYSYFDGVNSGSGFRITNDNFCTVLQSNQNCWKELVDSSFGQITIDEDISTTEYTISMVGAGSTSTIHLHKVSNTEIEAISSTGFNTTYIKQ